MYYSYYWVRWWFLIYFGYTIVGALSLFNNSSKRALFSSFVRFGSSTKYDPDEESSYIGVLSDNYTGLFWKDFIDSGCSVRIIGLFVYSGELN